MSISIDANRSLRPHAREPSVGLLRLGAIFVVLTAFDWLVVSSIPFMRTGSALAGILLAVTYASYRIRDLNLYKGPQLIALTFVLLMFLFAAWRVLEGRSAQTSYLMQWVQVQVMFIIFCDLTRHRSAFLYIWMVIVSVVLTMAVLGSLGLDGLQQQTSGGRVGLTTMNLNRQAYWYSLGLLTIVCLTLEVWRQAPRVVLFFLLISAGILIHAILKTGSRSALLSIAVALPLLMIFLARNRNLKAYKIAVPVLLLAFISAALYFSTALDRLSATAHGGEDQSRLIIWEQASDLVRTHPFTGYGPGFIEVLSLGADHSQGINTHNTHLQISAAYGLPALCLWWFLIAIIGRRLWRRRHKPFGALFLSVIVLSMIYSLTGDLGYNRYFWIMLALAGNVRFMDTLLTGRSGSLLRELGWESKGDRRRRMPEERLETSSNSIGVESNNHPVRSGARG